jgi:AraC family transcriptional regulator
MEWLTAIRKSIDYIETHLKEDITVQDIANQVFLSSLHFQRDFLIVTGYSVSEYIRNRRLYLSAIELKQTSKRNFT